MKGEGRGEEFDLSVSAGVGTQRETVVHPSGSAGGVSRLGSVTGQVDHITACLM